jgi:pilus assembly protein CpaF
MKEDTVDDRRDPATPARAALDRRRLLRSSTTDAAARLKTAAGRSGLRLTPEESEQGAKAAKPGRADYLAVKAALHERLLDEISERGLLDSDGADVAALVQEFAARAIQSEEMPLNEAERVRLAEELTDETIGMGPLAPLLADPAVSDILVNGPDRVYVERFGKLERTNVRFRDADHIVRVIERIAARVGRRIDTAWPMADLRLPDGSRVNATLAPVTIDGPTLSIRRFGRRRLRRDDLLTAGALSPDMMDFLVMAVRARKNILISGGTGAGKSTLLGVLAEAISETERIVTIEDTAELILDQEHLVRMETRPANIEGRGRIVARDLVINALRMRPDRIIVGEVRGAEALDMLQAMNTGHDGGMSTIHANSPRDAMSRLETMVLMAGTELPSRAVREQIVSAIQLLVHVRRYDDGVRRIESIAEITGLEGLTPLMQDLFLFTQRGRQGRRIVGSFSATGVVPRMVDDLREQGVQVSPTLFQRSAELPS